MTLGSTLRHPVRRPCALAPAVSAVYWGAHGAANGTAGDLSADRQAACSTFRLLCSRLMRRLCHATR